MQNLVLKITACRKTDVDTTGIFNKKKQRAKKITTAETMVLFRFKILSC